LVTSLFFLWGFAYGLLDVLNKHFQNVLHITKLQSTGLQVAYFGIGYFAFSPVAGEVMKRRGYKFTIIMGLSLYSLGAILFWPVAKFSGKSNNQAIFGGFVVCTAVIACGLATLETAANSYVSVMPPHNVANFRLQFSQSFNGVASFTGPLIASKYFFSDGNANDLTNVQWVYLAVAGMGVMVALMFFFSKLPEVSEEALQAEAEALADAHGDDVMVQKPFWKQTRAITGFVCQFM
jgi:FHS family L-fucose permease-like MFS transporter